MTILIAYDFDFDWLGSKTSSLPWIKYCNYLHSSESIYSLLPENVMNYCGVFSSCGRLSTDVILTVHGIFFITFLIPTGRRLTFIFIISCVFHYHFIDKYSITRARAFNFDVFATSITIKITVDASFFSSFFPWKQANKVKLRTLRSDLLNPKFGSQKSALL